MSRTHIRSVRSGAAGLALIVAAGLVTRDAHAQLAPADSGPRLGLAIRSAGFAIGGALALELFAPRVWFEVHAGALPPPPSPPPPLPAPPPPSCCYAPPPEVVMIAPVPPPASEPLHLGLAAAGLFQSPGSGPTSIAGVAASLQIRTSPHSLFGLELQSLTSDRAATSGSRRDELAGLMVGRLFAWDAALAPYLELAGGLGHASIDTQALAVSASQLIGRAGIGLEMRLGPHLVLDTQIAQVHRLRFDDPSRTVAANDPAFIGQHERSTELRCGLGYRF
jgi:hypothetical protein